MLYLSVKTLHVLAATLFLGTGIGSAYYKFRADQSGDLRVVAWAQRAIVTGDLIFIVPAGVLLPATGLWMATDRGWPLTSGFVFWGLLGYAVAGVTWLPAAYLQLRMRRAADEALARGEALPEQFERDRRVWLALGFPSFIAAMTTVYVMVFHNAAF